MGKSNMKKYHVIYESSIDHDCCTVWTEANSKEDAINDVMFDYWDVDSIIEVQEVE